MNKRTPRTLCSVIVTRSADDAEPIASVGRPIMDPGAYVQKMLDPMGLGFAGVSVITDCIGRKDLPRVLDGLRERGIRIEGEEPVRMTPDARGRLVTAMRAAGLKVRVRNANVDGDAQRLLVTGDAGAFFDACNGEQQRFLCRLGLRNGQTGVFDVV